jgi:hypothetical protein
MFFLLRSVCLLKFNIDLRMVGRASKGTEPPVDVRLLSRIKSRTAAYFILIEGHRSSSRWRDCGRIFDGRSKGSTSTMDNSCIVPSSNVMEAVDESSVM